MKQNIELFVILCCFLQAGVVVCIPLQQFLPFGGVYDDTSGPITLDPPYRLFGRQRNSLHIMSNGVLSLSNSFAATKAQPFPHMNGTAIISPFWTDANIAGTKFRNNGDMNSLNRVTEIFQESLRYTFNPTGAFSVTWENVSYNNASSRASSFDKNTFQCVLATNGQDTFILFLYADGLIQWARSCDNCSYAQVGVDGGDGVNYYSIPNSLTPEIINITHTSNVNTPGLWILKVDNNIITGPPVMLGLEVSGGVILRRMNYVAVLRERVMLTCSFLADPRPSVTWLLNSTNINTNQAKYRVTKTSEDTGSSRNHTETLMILSVAKEDQGNYTCLVDPIMVTNSLQVIVPPTVTPINRRPIGVENRNIRFGFTITQDDPHVAPNGISWTYTNTTDNTSTNVSSLSSSRFQLSTDRRLLTILGINFFDAGFFTLTATNEAGAGNGTLELVIHVEPTFPSIISHSNGTLEEGETAVFSCSTDGYPLPNIVWLHDGQFVVANSLSRHSISLLNTSSTNRDYLLTRNSTLQVPSLRSRDTGEYRCRVDPANIISGGSSMISNPLSLAVISAPTDYCTPDPCVNGVCSNQSSTYHCTCMPATEWTGVNCSMKVLGFEEVRILEKLVLYKFPELSASVNLTCRATGMMEPSFTWFKDNSQLLGERSRTLVIREVGISNRGLYRCKAEIFDPINQQVFQDESDKILMNINGLAQYIGSISSTVSDDEIAKRQARAHRSIIDTLATQLSGMMVDENTTILSITSTDINVPGEGTPILITLLAENGGSSELTERLLILVNTTRDIAFHRTLQRLDGCLEDTSHHPALEAEGLDITLQWPETSLGAVATIDCPCGNLSALGGVKFGKTASRRCGGNFTAGGVWDEGRIAACNFSLITRQLCEVAKTINKPAIAIVMMERITRQPENINLDEFSVATILIEALSIRLESNRSLIEGLFEIVDHLLDVDPITILASQQESNATARILEVVENVAQSIPLDENEASTSILLNSFGVGVTRIQDITIFEGHVFSVDLGMNFATEDGDEVTLANGAVSFIKSAESTAALSIAPSSFRDSSILASISSARERNSATTERPRIVNSVYLTDALFPRWHTISGKFTPPSVGSVILSSTLFFASREVRVSNVHPPITITFVKRRSLFNGTNTDATCNFWDFEANEGFGDWSTMNCTLVSNKSSDSKAVCQCTHLTNFAILLDPNPVDRTEPPELKLFLSAVSYIGVFVSIICLIVTAITYLASRKLRRSEAGQLLLNLCFGLLGIYILFVICLETTRNKYACAVTGGLLHYFLLVSFLLMAAEAINLFLKLVIVLGVPPILKDRYVLKSTLISWSMPLVIVIASVAPDYTKYTDDTFCRPYGAPFYGGLVAPFAVIYVLNWIIFIAIFASLCHKKSAKREGDKKGERKKRLIQQFTTAFTLSILFGLGWAVGFAATTSIKELEVSAILQALFILLTGFQGLLIFIMQCVRSQDVRKEWQRWIQAITCKRITFDLDKKLSCGPQSLSREYTYQLKSASSLKSAKPFESFANNESAIDLTLETVDVDEKNNEQLSHSKTTPPADESPSFPQDVPLSPKKETVPTDPIKELDQKEKGSSASVDMTLMSPDVSLAASDPNCSCD